MGFLVIDRGHSGFALGDPPVIIDVIRQEAFLLAVRDMVRHDVVEGMVTPRQFSLESQTRLLKQVDNHVSSRQLATSIEPNTDELTKSRGVVISDSLGITPGLKDRVSLDNLVLKGGLSFLPLSRGADGGKVRDDFLGIFSLSSTRFTSNQDGLIHTRVHHALVGTLSNSKDMRGALVSPLTNIDLHSS